MNKKEQAIEYRTKHKRCRNCVNSESGSYCELKNKLIYLERISAKFCKYYDVCVDDIRG